jgi:hypothetical protein
MAEVYKVSPKAPVRGKKLQKAIGLHEDVQARLALEAELGAFRADANLAIVRAKPGYDIPAVTRSSRSTKGKVDRYVILNDERGLGAAMTIEYGRKAAPDGPAPPARSTSWRPRHRGLFILHDAMHLSRHWWRQAEVSSQATSGTDDEL